MFGTGFWCSIRPTDLIQYHDYLLGAMRGQLKKIEIKTSQKDKHFLNKPLLKTQISVIQANAKQWALLQRILSN